MSCMTIVFADHRVHASAQDSRHGSPDCAVNPSMSSRPVACHTPAWAVEVAEHGVEMPDAPRLAHDPRVQGPPHHPAGRRAVLGGQTVEPRAPQQVDLVAGAPPVQGDVVVVEGRIDPERIERAGLRRVVYVNRAANACGPLQGGLNLEKTLVANSCDSFQSGPPLRSLLATGSRAAKCEQRVGARGVPANQASTLTRLIAAAVMRGCRCALAWPIERQRRSPPRRMACSWGRVPISANLPLFPRAPRLLHAAFGCLSGRAQARCSSQVRTVASWLCRNFYLRRL